MLVFCILLRRKRPPKAGSNKYITQKTFTLEETLVHDRCSFKVHTSINQAANKRPSHDVLLQSKRPTVNETTN